MDKNTLQVFHDQANHRFEIETDSQIAKLVYVVKEDSITFTHTGVPPALEGNGIGSMLVKAGLEYARANNLKVKSLCWFVSGYIERHPESIG